METGRLSGLSVLVVDDEEMLRDVVSMMVEEQGAAVTTASDGLQALEVLDAHSTEINLVVLDFSMARMNGFETYVEMEKRGGVRGYLMISGLRAIPEIQKLLSLPTVSFLAKPFAEEELVTCLISLAEATGVTQGT